MDLAGKDGGFNGSLLMTENILITVDMDPNGPSIIFVFITEYCVVGKKKSAENIKKIVAWPDRPLQDGPGS